MSFDIDDYLEAEEQRAQRAARTRSRRPTTPRATPQPKASYEGNAEVQQWLKQHDIGDDAQKPPFAAHFLANRRDAPWLRSSLAHFYEHDLINDILREIKSGKEASVFCCTAHPNTGEAWLAAKIYRPRIFRSLSNDAVYRANRDQRDESGRILSARRRQRAASHSDRDRAQQITDWIGFEFATQSLLFQAGVATPRPHAQLGNAILMAYLGDADNPAPRLSDLELAPDEAHACYNAILADIECCLGQHRVHGDLSPYNILYWEQRPWLIDFAQAVDARYHDEAVFDLLLRDVARVCAYFQPYGITAPPEALTGAMWRRYLQG